MDGHRSIVLTGKERTFDRSDIIVSKTNLQGHIVYANRLFMKLADLDEGNVIGKPHSIIRHPEMPRCVFKLLWDTIQAGREIFAYVVNRSMNGDHYWVIAHVTPSFDAGGSVTGYHSNRRVPDRAVVDETIIPLYRLLIQEENGHASRKEGMNASHGLLMRLLKDKGLGYDEFIFSLGHTGH